MLNSKKNSFRGNYSRIYGIWKIIEKLSPNIVNFLFISITIYSIMSQICLRTEVRGDINIHGSKYFQDAVFHQKIKKLWCCKPLYVWWLKKPVLSMKCWHSWLLLKIPSKDVFSNNQLCQYFMKRTGLLAHQRYRRLLTSWIFDFWYKTVP